MMHLLTLIFSLALFSLRTFAQADEDAPITQDNPTMATFQAVLQLDKPVQGQITGVSNGNGTGVNFNVNFFSFPPASAGPFAYHIHEFPVPQGGDCNGTGGHLSPYDRNETPPCDATQPDTCQPGDLSGKHGAIADTAREKNFQVTYLDLYLSTNPESLTFFGNRSVVVHAVNGMRLNCGNFTQQVPSNTTFGNGTASATASPSSATHTGGGSRLMTYDVDLTFGAGLLAMGLAMGSL